MNYRKALVKYVLARTNEYSSAMQLIKDKKHTDGHSMGSRSMERSKGTTIKNCFEKGGIIKNDDLMETGEKDLEFEVLCSATKYMNFKPLSFTESLKMLDKINKCSSLDEESYEMLSTATKKLENLQLQNKKQKSMISYFS